MVLQKYKIIIGSNNNYLFIPSNKKSLQCNII